ncbi:hypothetical protein R3P38DRAFT_3260733 [Favolaschia claudopus]|uniref:Uncharacterized protein n=1 Tax=Favolaschia claudopus TaxID=2862362 RepID=A0AAW0CSV1_9AGAR
MFLTSFPERSSPHILEELNKQPKTGVIDGMYYPTTKLFSLYTAREISKLPLAKGIVVNIVDPGFCSSDLLREVDIPAIFRRIPWSCAKGSLNLVYAALNPTPPGAFVMAAQVRPSILYGNHDADAFRGPYFTLDKAGIEVQKRVWEEMKEVWCRVASQVAGVVGSR